MERFVVATGNPDKAREIGEVFSATFDAAFALLPLHAVEDDAPVGFVIIDPSEDFDPASLPVVVTAPDVEETGTTLEENARIKARGVSEATGLAAIADDTGLEVDALDGAPGVHSARYAGEDATYAENVGLLLRELTVRGAEGPARTARFATVALAAWPDGREIVARGEVEGAITPDPRGVNGFGYDPVFAPDRGDGRTFAEMSSGEKHAISHRGRAFRALVDALGASDGFAPPRT